MRVGIRVRGRIPQKKTVQSSITSMGFPLLQKPGEMCVGRQIGVPGKFWNFNRGRMSEEETATLFKCTVCGFHALHKWAGGGAPSQTMMFQEMRVDGQDSTEPGGSNDDRKISNTHLVQVYMSKQMMF